MTTLFTPPFDTPNMDYEAKNEGFIPNTFAIYSNNLVLLTLSSGGAEMAEQVVSFDKKGNPVTETIMSVNAEMMEPPVPAVAKDFEYFGINAEKALASHEIDLDESESLGMR
jgi:hypothetical protein